MAVRAFRIENFMAFGEAAGPDDGWIELQPICLLFGRNSSGKSAIIRALRLLKQSLVDAPPGSPFAYSVEDGVDVGSFLEMAHRPYPPGDPPIVRFGFRCDVSPMTLGRLSGMDAPAPDSIAWVDLTLSFGWLTKDERAGIVGLLIETPVAVKGDELERVVLLGADLIESPADEGLATWWRFWSDLLNTDVEDSIWQFVNVRTSKVLFADLEVPNQDVRQEIDARGQSWRSGDDYKLMRSLFEQVGSNIASFLNSIQHMPPLRPEPKRVFVLDYSQQRRWRQQGLAGYVTLLQQRFDENQRTTLVHWLQKLQLGLGIIPKPHTDVSPDRAVVTELLLDETEEGVHDVNLTDMGYGVSQVLPVLIQAILAEPGELVIVEQPELHLHPGAQAKLGDMFVEMAQRGVHFLIETHSEHLLLRLQKQIARTTAGEPTVVQSRQMLLPNQLAIYFVNREEGVSTAARIAVGTYGDLLNTPRGFEDFFSDDTIETAERMRIRLSGAKKKD